MLTLPLSASTSARVVRSWSSAFSSRFRMNSTECALHDWALLLSGVHYDAVLVGLNQSPVLSREGVSMTSVIHLGPAVRLVGEQQHRHLAAAGSLAGEDVVQLLCHLYVRGLHETW